MPRAFEFTLAGLTAAGDGIPIPLPFLPPTKGTMALQADFLRQVGLFNRLPLDPHD